MSFYFRLFVLIIISVLISFFLFLELSSASFDSEHGTEYPVGSFEVHMFFERHQNHL
ncbi:conserved hypothetical protein [Vibrio rotiferianus]|jgi:hypothetical protein|nr:conserved hypothetical protein [Vibrio rotiferianus]